MYLTEPRTYVQILSPREQLHKALDLIFEAYRAEKLAWAEVLGLADVRQKIDSGQLLDHRVIRRINALLTHLNARYPIS